MKSSRRAIELYTCNFGGHTYNFSGGPADAMFFPRLAELAITSA